jgi:hypothetical protein
VGLEILAKLNAKTSYSKKNIKMMDLVKEKEKQQTFINISKSKEG